MGCVKFKYNPSPTFINWRLYQGSPAGQTSLISAYREQPGRDMHLPVVSMALVDFINFGFNKYWNGGYSYGFNAKNMDYWLSIYEDDLVDSKGNTIICTAEYGVNDIFEGLLTDQKTVVYDHGYTTEFYTSDGQYFPVKDNFYPFNSGDCKQYIKYYGKDEWTDEDEPYYLGDAFYLWVRLQDGVDYDEEAKGPVGPMLPDGDTGGWFYADSFDLWLGFGDIVEYNEWFHWGFKFKVRGVYEEFTVVNLGYDSSGLPSDLPAIKDRTETNGYSQWDQYYRYVNGVTSNRHKWDFTFCMSVYNYEEFELWIKTIMEGKEAYDAEYGPFSAKANRRELANQRPARANRIAKHHDHHHGHDH